MTETDDRFRMLVDAVVDYAIYMLSPAGIVTSWNRGAERFKGYNADEILGKHFSTFYTPEDRATGLPQRALDTAAREGRFEQEGWRVRKDGTRFWAHVIIDPIRASSGELLGYAKITRDLTERRKSQDALRQSEDRFRLLVQGVTDYALYMLDPTGHVASWNAGAERIKGYSSDEIIGEHFSRFYTEEDRATGLPARALQIAQLEGRYEKEGWRLRKDGTRFWASVVIDPVHDESGRLVGFAKITRDITERKKAQEALDTARQNLFHSQKMEALGGLTGGVAHDFNNLLSAVLGSLELARKRIANDPQVVRLIDNAIAGAQRGANLTQRMLAFARRQELRPEPVDVVALVRGMDDLFRLSIGSTVTVETSFPHELDAVKADANQLEMALLNLVVNARDALPDGGAITITGAPETITARPGEKLPPGQYVRLSVEDNGVGMDEATLSRATDPFFTTKPPGKGSGLGLSVVHGVVEQLGGRLLIKSHLGLGTTVDLWLPVMEEGSNTVSLRPDQPATVGGTARFTILAVDDDAIVLLNTAAMLEDLGHRVFAASSGQEALNVLRREPSIDLVVTDEIMPRMTGSQLARAIGKEWPHVPILLATGYAEVPDEGGRALPRLSKPFWQADLERAIGSLLPTQPHKAGVVELNSVRRNGGGQV